MFDVLERLYRIARAGGSRKVEELRDYLTRDKYDAFHRETFEDDFQNTGRTSTDDRYTNSGFKYEYSSSSKNSGEETGSSYPRQVVEDLAVFDLKPPSSMEAVRKARNREIRKYHSDKFINDPERFETSKQIMQIINAAYDRLKAYYGT